MTLGLKAEQKIIWITWERQIRNHSMSKALGVPLFEILSNRKRIPRYVSCISRTVALIGQKRPSVVVCQNPSLVLSILLLRLRPFLGFKVVIDAHFGGVEAYNRSKTLQRVLNHCNRSADLVIVTNEGHARYINRLGGKTFICPDPLPDLSRFRSEKKEVPRKVFFICSFDPDEPYLEVFKAAKVLNQDGFRFFVSGDFRKAGISPRDFPRVEFLGFAPENEYYRHLFSSQLVVDLTDNDNCLVCGAYEALEAEKPLVLSNRKALQEYFTEGTVFTANNSQAIVSAIRRAYAERRELREACRQWARHAKDEMRSRINLLYNTLRTL